MNTYQTVTRQSWGSKIKSALAGIILGPLLILGSCVLLWYNENRSFERTQDINYAEKELISLPDTHFSPENNEKFIHMTGPIAGKSISDPLINLTLSGILLSREVEMYQWKESSSSQSQDELGGSTTTTTQYSYTKEWSTTLISSDNFAQANGHTNPKSFPYSAEKFLDTEARLGDFTFSSELLNILPRGKEIPLSEVHTSLLSGSTLLGNTLYLSQNPTNPQIGDIRFTYTGIENGDVLSVLAMQNADSSLSKFPAKHGTVESIAWGKASGGEMIESLRTQNTFLTWGLRILGLLLQYIGWNMFFSILPVLAAIIPFVSKIIGFGTSTIALILTLILGGSMILMAWILVRPLFAIPIVLGIIILIVFLIKQKIQKNKAIQTSIS